METNATRYSRRMFRFNWTLAAKCLVVGLVGGVLVGAYRLGAAWCVDAALAIYSFAHANLWALALLALAAVLVGSGMARLVAWEPMAGGSGIPQTEGVLSFVLKMRWWSILIVRFLGGLPALVMGLSLGREGPSVQIGAACGQAVDRVMGHHGGVEETCLVTAGSAAGLSAAFSAPLSGLVFALEEMHRSFSPVLLLGAATASVAASGVAQAAFGLTPVLSFGEVVELGRSQYPWLLLLAVLCGLTGCLLNAALLLSQRLYGKLPAKARPVLACLIAIPVGLLAPDLLGGGAPLVGVAEAAQVGLVALLALLAGKILFTGASFGCGAPGGIFLPTLAIGALAGGALGLGLAQAGLLPHAIIAQFAILGMAATFAACVKAPVTGILLVVEMTGSLTHLLPVTVVTLVALLVSDALGVAPIYNTLLDRYVEAHGRTTNRDDGSRLFEVQVEPGSALDGQMLGEVDWPASSLVVSIHKAERTVTPRPATRIRSGDHLIATPQGDREKAKADLAKLARR